MRAANRVAMNTGILYARMAVTVFISLYSTKVVLGALGVEDFGTFNLVAGIISMLTFLNSAMAAATQRFMSHARGAGDFDKLKNIFNVSLVLHILIGFCVLLVLEGVGFYFFNGVLKIPEGRIDAARLIYQFAILSTLFTIISVPYDAVINANENMLLYAVISILEAFLRLAVAFYIKNTTQDKLVMYGVLSAAVSILVLLINRIYCHKRYAECKISIRKNFDKVLFKQMASFGGWSLLGSMVGMLSNYGQGVVINVFFGTVVNAAQGIAGQISGQLGAFSAVMLKALNPIIVKSEGGGNRGLMLRSAMTGSKFSFFLLAFFAIPAIIEMPYILHIWLKEVPEFAIVFCRLLLIKNLVEQLFITLPVSIAATGNIKSYQISISCLAIFPLIISFFLFKMGYAPSTMYVVFIIQSVIRSLVILYYAEARCQLSVPVFVKEVILRCLITTIVIVSASLLMQRAVPHGGIRLIAVVITSGIAFLAAVNWIGLIKEEQVQIKNIAVSVLSKFRRKIAA